ncbi:indoleacetate decarboxylase activase [Muricomes sp. OA1]|nr:MULTISPECIES: indoleacetate decarboxylase activase [Clostridia]MCH1973106.1 indoleacetate decarboxylase activase [Muricomes sp. OA1]GKH31885.1 glycyl-radical enzyme activating protein [Faecalicatena contorta]
MVCIDMENKDEMKALVFDIQSFSTHDGPGIRTNIFFKGCPLTCLWCANPEGQKAVPQLFYTKMKCAGCMFCAKVCPHDAVTAYETPEEIEKYGFVRHDREKCDKCKTHDCVGMCLQNALEITGKWMTVDDIMEKVHRDASYYAGKGGVTLSGGDPLIYPEFVTELLRRCKNEGINTALESELCVPCRNLELVMPYIDLYLTDIKIIDEQKHIEMTGASNKQILENLRFIGHTCPEKACLRYPIIPGCTDSEDNVHAIGKFCRDNGFSRVNILPYHKLGSSKHERLGSTYLLPDVQAPGDEEMRCIADILETYAITCIIN